MKLDLVKFKVDLVKFNQPIPSLFEEKMMENTRGFVPKVLVHWIIEDLDDFDVVVPSMSSLIF